MKQYKVKFKKTTSPSSMVGTTSQRTLTLVSGTESEAKAKLLKQNSIKESDNIVILSIT